MRVLFLTHSYPRRSGDAAGSFLLHLAIALRDHGVEVAVVAPAGDRLPATEVLDGIPVHRFRYAPRRFEKLAYTGQMAEEVKRSLTSKLALVSFLGGEFATATRVRREFEPHVVHAHWWFPSGLVGSWVGRMSGLPLVITMHGSDVRLAEATRLAAPLLRVVTSHASAVTVVSPWLASRLSAMAPKANPLVSPMPVATSLFTPGGLRHDRRFLFVGRLNAQKGIELLLQALAGMATKAALDVVGDGPAGNALRRKAGELGIAERVSWHGSLPQPQLVEFYRAATALVVPSLGEGFGLVAVEAQLCETPVIAFDSGGLSTVVDDGVSGFLVPPGDVQRLSRTMEAVIGDTNRERIGRAGRQSALALYAPESVSLRYAQLYSRVTGSDAA